MSNRFAALYVDDDDELSPPVECLPITPSKKPEIPSTKSAFTKIEPPEKKQDKKKQIEHRDFGNLANSTKKDIFNKRNPFRKTIGSRYAFKDDTPRKPLVSPLVAPYKFIDESVPLEPFQKMLPQEIKDSPQTIIFSSTIGNRVNSDPSLTSLYR